MVIKSKTLNKKPLTVYKVEVKWSNSREDGQIPAKLRKQLLADSKTLSKRIMILDLLADARCEIDNLYDEILAKVPAKRR